MSGWTEQQVRQALRERRSSIEMGQAHPEERRQCRSAWTALCARADSFVAGDVGLAIQVGDRLFMASWQCDAAIRVAVRTLTSYPEQVFARLAVPPADNEVRFVCFMERRSGVVSVRLQEVEVPAGVIVAARGSA